MKFIKENLFITTILALALITVFLLSIAGNNTKNASNIQKMQVTTSFYSLYFFATQIAGNKAEIKNITPSGAEPHDYEPSTKDIALIEKSNMLIINGGIEPWGDRIKNNLKNTNVYIVVAGQGLLMKQIVQEGKTQTDSHVWLDPILAKQEAHAITDGFVHLDPANTSYYQQNEKTLSAKLDNIDSTYKASLANCKQKEIITSHAAFGYLASKYGFLQVPIAGFSPDAEPSAQQIAKIVTSAKEHHIKYIFFENLISPKLAQTIANEIDAKTLVLDPIEGLSNEDMKAGKNYVTIMQDNLKNLEIALECTQ